MHQISLSFLFLSLSFPLSLGVSLPVSHYTHPAMLFPLSHCFRKCSSSPQWNQLRHSWISLICGWFKCLIISPPRSGPHQSLYSQSNLITLTTKTIKSHCQIHLASPDSAAFHSCKQPMCGLVQMLSWSGFQNSASTIQTCHSCKMGNLHWPGWMKPKIFTAFQYTSSCQSFFDIPFILITWFI